MKKLLFILSLFITISSFGQNYYGLPNIFHDKPQYEFQNAYFAMEKGSDGRYVNTLTPERFKSLLSNPKIIKYLSNNTYSFFNKDKFYMLSYDDGCITCYNTVVESPVRLERNLYLFRLDDTCWTKVSNVIRTDYIDKEAYSVYFPIRNLENCVNITEMGGGKNGSVEVTANGDVVINIIYFTNITKHYSTNIIVKLKFDNDNYILE